MNPMAASSPNGAPAPLPGLVSARRIAQQATRTAPAPASAPRLRVRGADAATPGMLVNRPDLPEEAVLQAIRERMEFEGRDASKASAVLNAALAGRPVACSFLKRLVLPPPKSALQMPIQSILREPSVAAETRGSWLSRFSAGR